MNINEIEVVLKPTLLQQPEKRNPLSLEAQFGVPVDPSDGYMFAYYVVTVPKTPEVHYRIDRMKHVYDKHANEWEVFHNNSRIGRRHDWTDNSMIDFLDNKFLTTSEALEFIKNDRNEKLKMLEEEFDILNKRIQRTRTIIDRMSKTRVDEESGTYI